MLSTYSDFKRREIIISNSWQGIIPRKRSWKGDYIQNSTCTSTNQLSSPSRLRILNLSFQGSKVPLESLLRRIKPHIPDILTARPSLVFNSLLPVMVSDSLAAHLLRPPLCAHTQSEVLPVLATWAQLTVAVYIDELATEGLAEESVVEGRAAGHGVCVEGFGGDRGCGPWRGSTWCTIAIWWCWLQFPS